MNKRSIKGRNMIADKTPFSSGAGKDNNGLGVHNRIAEQLRAFYTVLQEEEIPQKFLTLLEQLDEVEKSENKAAAPAGAKGGSHKFGDPRGFAEKALFMDKRRSKHE